MASKLLVNATAQACGLGRTANADLGLRQSEHVQVGLPPHASRSILLCRRDSSTTCLSFCFTRTICLHVPAWGNLSSPQAP